MTTLRFSQTLSFLCLAVFCLGQKIDIRPDKKNGKWGFINTTTKEVTIPHRYEYVSQFGTTPYAVARLNGKHGLIDRSGSTLIPFIYDNLARFFTGRNEEAGLLLLMAQKDEKWGIVNQKGDITTSIEYDQLKATRDYWDPKTQKKRPAYIVQKEDKWGIIDWQNEVILPFVYDFIRWPEDGYCFYLKDGEFGIWHLDGSMEHPIHNQRVFKDVRFTDGLACVRFGQKYGLLNEDYEVVMPIKYGSFIGFGKNDYAITKLNGKFGCINKKEEHVVPFVYDYLTQWGGDRRLTITKLNGKYGLFNNNLEKIIPEKYDTLYFKKCYPDVFLAAKMNNKFGLIDSTGQTVIPIAYDYLDITYKIDSCVFRANKNNKWGLVNKRNETIWPVEYDSLEIFDRNIIKIYKEGQWSLFDLKRNKPYEKTSDNPVFLKQYVARPNTYSKNLNYSFKELYKVYNFSWQDSLKDRSYYLFEKEELTGVRDFYGNTILEPGKFKEIKDIYFEKKKERYLLVTDPGNKTGLFRSGEGLLLPFVYDDIGFFNEQLYKVKKNGKYGLVNRENEIVLPIEYDAIDGHRVKKGYQYGMISARGHLVLPVKYNDLRMNKYHLIDYALDRKKGTLNQDLEEVTNMDYEIRKSTSKRRERFFEELAKFDTSQNSKKIEVIRDGAVFWHLPDPKNRQAAKWLDRYGNPILPEGYTEPQHIYGPFFKVTKDGSYGLLNVVTGQEAIPAIYGHLAVYEKNGVIRAIPRKDGKYAVLDGFGNALVPFEYDMIHSFGKYQPFDIILAKKNGKEGCINDKNETLLPFEYDDQRGYSFGMIAIKKGDKWGYVNIKGETVIPFKFDFAFRFHLTDLHQAFVRKVKQIPVIKDSTEIFASVKIGKERFFIDHRGNIIEKASAHVTPKDGFIRPRKEKFMGLQDSLGNELLPATYMMIGENENGFIPLVSSSGNGYYLPAISQALYFDEIQPVMTVPNPLRSVKKGDLYGLINNEGGYVGALEYDVPPSQLGEGLYVVSKNKKIGFINARGETVIPFKYDLDKDIGTDMHRFHNGMSILMKGDKYGAIDKKENVVIPFEYGFIYPFENGKALARKDGKWVQIKEPVFQKK
ncbi:MAG: WG repeat-containing protein [Bacteroidota bacterium]